MSGGSYSAHPPGSDDVERGRGQAIVINAAESVGLAQRAMEMAVEYAKAYAGDAGRRVPRAALQVHGGIGFTWEHDLHFFLKRAQANAHAYGDARWHRDELAAALFD